jgi:hypothetical protein
VPVTPAAPVAAPVVKPPVVVVIASGLEEKEGWPVLRKAPNSEGSAEVYDSGEEKEGGEKVNAEAVCPEVALLSASRQELAALLVAQVGCAPAVAARLAAEDFDLECCRAAARSDLAELGVHGPDAAQLLAWAATSGAEDSDTSDLTSEEYSEGGSAPC